MSLLEDSNMTRISGGAQGKMWFPVKTYPFLNKTVVALINTSVRPVLSSGYLHEGYKVIDDGRNLYYDNIEQLRALGITEGTMFLILNHKVSEIDFNSPIPLKEFNLHGVMCYNKVEGNTWSHLNDLKAFIAPRHYNHIGIKFYWFDGESIRKA
jgi:hypothetical protein